MEKLQRRSDGIAETLSGLFAVAPQRFSGKDSEHKWFDFRKTAVSDVVRVRWPIDDEIAVIKAGTAIYLLEKGYARNVTDEQVSAWNDRIDQLDLDALDPAPVAIDDTKAPEVLENAEQPSGAQTGGEATNTPANAQTAPEGQDLANGGTPEGIAPAGEGTGTESGAGATEGTDPADNSGTVVGEDDATETTSEGEAKSPKGKKKPEKGLL